MLDAAPAPAPTRMRLTFNAARLVDWVRFDRRDFGLVLTLALAVTVINVSGSLPLVGDRPLLEIAGFAGFLFLDGVVLSISLVVALNALERFPIRGWRRHVTTIATGALVTGLVTVPFYYLLRPVVPASIEFVALSSGVAFYLFSVWGNAANALIARAWLVESREATQASKLLARIRSEQMSVRRRLVEGRLKAIQARVDPQFFFAMLEAVQKTYTVDVDRAEQLLDELTAFLRAALPRLRTTSSTVDQECELARSFARVCTLAGLGAPRLDIDVAPPAGTASFPPGVLLPLIDELLRAPVDTGHVGIAFSTDDAAPTVLMQLTGRAKPSSGVLMRTRATLVDLFGATANLTSIVIADGTLTTVQVPYEPASA